MITVSQAEQIILSHTSDYGTELVSLNNAAGRVLAEDIRADRDLPPCNRVTMDGIALAHSGFAAGIRNFKVLGTIAAGEPPVEFQVQDECIEIMTGCALPASADTVIRYEDVTITDGIATVNIDTIRKGQNIHVKGKDRRQGDVVATAGQFIDATVISMAASVGKEKLSVTKLPRVVIVSTGDELVDVSATPASYQIRQSNNHTIRASLLQYRINAEMVHICDDADATKRELKHCLEHYDVILLSGGVSMGKFDYVPQALDELQVEKHFHKVKQRPGKPFWFGTHANGVRVFAFPGNPVSTFMCLHRYFVPWLELSLGQRAEFSREPYASLAEEITFEPALQYFAQVKLHLGRQGQVLATPVEGNGSGDFANLLDSDAFIELPLEQSVFKKGEAFRIWPFKKVIA